VRTSAKVQRMSLRRAENDPPPERSRDHITWPAVAELATRRSADEHPARGAAGRAINTWGFRECPAREGCQGLAAPNEQPQNTSEGDLSEGEAHRAILPGSFTPPPGRTVLAPFERFWCSRAHVKLTGDHVIVQQDNLGIDCK
jgi:hypothetical protein